MDNGCAYDTLSLITSAFDTSYIYYINENTITGTFPTTLPGLSPQQKIYTAQWQETLPGCPIDFKLQILDSSGGIYRDLTSAESAVASLQNPISVDTSIPYSSQIFSTNQIELLIETGDYSLDL